MSYSGLKSRRLVIDVLSSCENNFKKALLDKNLADNDLTSADRRLATEFVNGVVRHAKTLQWLIRCYSHRQPQTIEVRYVLMLGIYQLLFMEHIPSYAAIDTSVRLLKQSHQLAKARYVNAILRKIQRESCKIDAADMDSTILPIRDNWLWRFARPIFPDPQRDLPEYWATVYSFPVSLVKSWQQQFGSKLCARLLQAANIPAPIFLRVSSKFDIEALVTRLQQSGTSCSLYNRKMIHVQAPGNISSLPGFTEGQWVIAGPTSMETIHGLDPRPGEKILDLCAAPGGKTLQIADLTAGDAEIVACDISASRLKLLESNMQRMQFSNLTCIHGDGTRLQTRYDNYFDRVLVDAPCSNTAVLSKRPEARWRFNCDSIRQLRQLQWQLLAAGAKALKVGGTLIYSTCSLQVEENQHVVEQACREIAELQCHTSKQILPLPWQIDGGTFFQLTKTH